MYNFIKIAIISIISCTSLAACGVDTAPSNFSFGTTPTPYNYITLGVVTEQSYRDVLTNISEKSGPVNVLNAPIDILLRQRFGKIVKLDNKNQAKRYGAQMVMVINAEASLPRVAFFMTTIHLKADLYDDSGILIDTISAKSEKRVPFPARSVAATVIDEAAREFGENLDRSGPALEFAVNNIRPKQPPDKSDAYSFSCGSTRREPVTFTTSPPNPNDVAVVIGNGNYMRWENNIPDVCPAYDDSEAIRSYVQESLGIPPGNVIFARDATLNKLTSIFGSKSDPRGRLWYSVKQESRVFVYFVGHGAPGTADNDGSYLLPVDADGRTLESVGLTGYPVQQLYDNLSKLQVKEVTVLLEACFSGRSQGGTVVNTSSSVGYRDPFPHTQPAIRAKAQIPPIDTPPPSQVVAPPEIHPPANITVISAGAADQMARWVPGNSHSLFTFYFLKGMSGEADRTPYGDGDGKVSLDELERYVKDKVNSDARKYYGSDQTVQINRGPSR